MAENFLKRALRIEFAPPRYLSLPAAGFDISTSGIKMAVLAERLAGLELIAYGEELLPMGAVTAGEITDPEAVTRAIEKLARKLHTKFANIALSESRSYLFETTAEGSTTDELRTSVERHLDEFVPLPPNEVSFDIAQVGPSGASVSVVGVGYARRVVEASLSTLDEAGITTCAIESETFSMARALTKKDSTETVLIIDIGKTTTKLMVVTGQVPRFATTLDIGGHALTEAVMKHFNVSEEEAKTIKAERGLAGGVADEYVTTMLITASAIREEIMRRLQYWQNRATEGSGYAPVSRVILAGGNATIRGLPEYLETSLKLPVELGDVFTNLASRDVWLPPIEYLESLAYATAIGLALRDH